MTVHLTQEESAEILIDDENLALATGWTDSTAGASSCFRTGSQVALVLRVKNAAKANALITTLPANFCPAVTVTDAAKKLQIEADGKVKSTEGATPLESAEVRAYDITFRAKNASP